jgi:opacity protein-like surface antigen
MRGFVGMLPDRLYKYRRRPAVKVIAAIFVSACAALAAGSASAQTYLAAGGGSHGSVFGGLGYQFNRSFATEASYFSARVKVTETTTGNTLPGPGLVPPGGAPTQQAGESVEERRLEGLGISAVGTLPIGGPVSLVGELGTYRMSLYATLEQWVFSAGAGVRVALPANFAARLMYRHTGSSGGIPNTDTIGVHAVYSF